MKSYKQHSIAYHLEFRSPKEELLFCGDCTQFINKKEIDNENIS